MTKPQVPGQEPFEGMRPKRDLDSLNAFARAVTPEYWDLSVVDYQDVTEKMIASAAPDRLRPDLIDVRSSAPFTASYEDEFTGKEVNVPLLPEEYTLFLRSKSPRRYGEVVIARTMAGKGSLQLSGDSLREKAEAASVDAIEAKLAKLDAYLDGTLQPGSALLASMQEAAKHPGLWRKHEGDMRIAMDQILSFFIPNALKVIGNSRQWTDEQAALAAKAVQYRLFFDRTHNRHLGNWKLMLDLLQAYQEEKIQLFGDRRGRLTGYLRQHKVE